MKTKNYLLAFFSLLNLNLISAASYDFENARQMTFRVIESIIGLIAPVFEFLIGDYSSNEFFLAKSLLLILLFVIINVSLKKVRFLQENKIGPIVAAIISILAIRSIQENELFRSILLPYSTIGIAITTLLPFLAFFYFIHATRMIGAARKLAWGLFAIIFIALWIEKYESLTPLGNNIFIGTAILLALVVLLDKSIHRYFYIHDLNIFYRKAKSRSAAKLQAEYLEILNVDTTDANRRKQEIEEHLKRIGADIP